MVHLIHTPEGRLKKLSRVVQQVHTPEGRLMKLTRVVHQKTQDDKLPSFNELDIASEIKYSIPDRDCASMYSRIMKSIGTLTSESINTTVVGLRR